MRRGGECRDETPGGQTVVRELDALRQRELWRLVGVSTILAGMLLFSAWQHFELLQHGYRIEQMQRQRAEEEELNRHLRLEVETLLAPQRIERLAREQLHLVAPSPEATLVIERVTPSAPPASTIVAARRP